MRIIKGILTVGLVSVLLYSVLIVLRHPNKSHCDSRDTFVFSKGNAPEDVRAEIVRQLRRFHDGCTPRDISQLEPFMDQLFSKDNVLILGTQPTEVLNGHDRAVSLTVVTIRTLRRPGKQGRET